MSLKNTLSVFVMVLFVMSSASVFADPIVFQWTDTSSEVPGSMFTLTITSLGGVNYNAVLEGKTFDQLGIFGESWYINYITLHLDGGQSPTSLTLNSVVTEGPVVHGNWMIVEGGADKDLLKRMHFPQSSWMGLYTTDIEDDGIGVDTTQGVLLDGLTTTWDFDFELAADLNEFPSIQVGYFGEGDYNRGGQYKFDFTQMSETVIPEPATLLLVGSGLLGGAFFRKRSKQ